MVDVPAEFAVTTPSVAIEATDGNSLLHVPPVVLLVSAVVAPTQAAKVPPIDAGNGLIVTTKIDEQPVAKL